MLLRPTSDCPPIRITVLVGRCSEPITLNLSVFICVHPAEGGWQSSDFMNTQRPPLVDIDNTRRSPIPPIDVCFNPLCIILPWQFERGISFATQAIEQASVINRRDVGLHGGRIMERHVVVPQRDIAGDVDVVIPELGPEDVGLESVQKSA